MVVVSIIMVLTGVGAVSLTSFSHNQKLEGAKGELIADLRLARNMAITSQTPEGTTGSLVYVLVTVGNGTVTSNGIWIDGSGGSNDDEYFSKDNEAANGEDSSFGFSIENGRLTDDIGDLRDTLVLTLSLLEDVDNSKCVEINSLGLISEVECP